jgi:hypothetical protein
MTFATNHIAQRLGARLSRAGHSGVGYFKTLLDLLSGRRNLFF